MNKFNKAAIKRTAQNVDKFVTSKLKINSKINELKVELANIEKMQAQWEAPIVAMTGHTTEELVDKVVENTGKVDKKGNPIKITKFVLKYPDTIVPPGTTMMTPREAEEELFSINNEDNNHLDY